jgi:hypothetical protein
MSRSLSSASFLAAALVLSFASGARSAPQAGPAFPVKPSPSGRYLVDQGGVAFPILGDAGWSASKNLTATEIAQYLDDRKARGFTAVLTEAIEHKFTINKPPLDQAGNLPFSKRLDASGYTGSPNGCTTPSGSNNQFAADPYSNINAQAPDFTFPVSAYWTGLDAFLSDCQQRGMLVFLFPAYVGYAGGDEGWMGEMVANDALPGSGGQAGQPFADNTKSRLWNYGAWMASRYKSFTNLIWVHGGDYGNNPSNGGAFTTAQKNAVNSLFAGMKSVAGQSSVLHTAHWSRRSLSTDLSFSAGSFDLEAVYTDQSSAQYALGGYAHAPTLPAFEIEDYYEGNPSGGEPDRRFQWWAELSAIGGFFFGNETLWRFNVGWATSLNSPGSQDMARLNAFVKGLAWENLVPSGQAGMKTLVTAGGGTANPQSTDFVASAASPDGKLLVAYVPPAHTGSLTVDLTALSASVQARWFDPTSATYTAIGTFPNTGPHSFTTPGTNSGGAADWVLVLEPGSGGSTPPVITTQPAGQTVTAGQTATFSVSATGTAPLSYQWQQMSAGSATWTNVGTNSSSYTTVATTTADSGSSFRVVVTNSAGMVTSTSAPLTVNPSGGGGGGGGTTSGPVAINSGGGAAGAFLADVDFSGGNTSSTTASIDTIAVSSPPPGAVYQSERWGVFSYTVPGLTPGGAYTVRLHFAEIYFKGAGQRVFNVSINGVPVLTNFDVFAVAGAADKAIAQEFPATASASGQIVVQYSQGAVDWPKSSGLEIVAGSPAGGGGGGGGGGGSPPSSGGSGGGGGGGGGCGLMGIELVLCLGLLRRVRT